MTERTLARAIISHRIDRVKEFIYEARRRYGDEFVDKALSYISTVLNECEPTVTMCLTKTDVEMIVASLYTCGFNRLADKLVKDYERK